MRENVVGCAVTFSVFRIRLSPLLTCSAATRDYYCLVYCCLVYTNATTEGRVDFSHSLEAREEGSLVAFNRLPEQDKLKEWRLKTASDSRSNTKQDNIQNIWSLLFRLWFFFSSTITLNRYLLHPWIHHRSSSFLSGNTLAISLSSSLPLAW